MTNLPPDQIDPYEGRLAGRVRAYTDRATAPIDAAGIAAEAAAGRGRGRRAGGVFKGVLSGAFGLAALAIVLVAVVALGSKGLNEVAGQGAPTAVPSSGPTGIATSSPSPVPSSSSAAPGDAVCDPATLAARITSWTGAAGNRIASIELRNDGDACLLPLVLRPELIDGRGRVLIEGASVTSSKTMSLATGATVTTLVDDANYCGPAPTPPVTVAFVLPDGGRIIADALSPADPTAIPPCNGPDAPSSIEMRSWKR